MSEDTTGQHTEESIITLAHGAGGNSMRSLLDDLVVSRFAENGDSGATQPTIGLSALDDGAIHQLNDGALVLTTDSHVVSPRFFPGGDIGRLAVAGTVNDLAVMGATRPTALTCSLVLEEGTPTDEVKRVIESMAETAEQAGVPISTGDTKVMENGAVDGIVVNTAGVAFVDSEEGVSDAGLEPGDVILVTGSMGDHGISLLSAREGFDFTGDLESDVSPVNHIVEAALDAGRVTAMKDPTRGGLANALNEMAQKAGVGIELDEGEIPVSGPIESTGEVLGIDPLSVANEGKVVMGIAEADADTVLNAIQDCEGGEEAAIIGSVTEDHTGRVVVDTGFGRRYLSEPSGEPLPRIC